MLLTVVTWVGALAAGIAGLVYLAGVIGRIAAGVRRLVHLVDDLIGEPARGELPPRLGLLDRLVEMDRRLTKVEAELSPNGGKSVKDQVTALAAASVAARS